MTYGSRLDRPSVRANGEIVFTKFSNDKLPYEWDAGQSIEGFRDGTDSISEVEARSTSGVTLTNLSYAGNTITMDAAGVGTAVLKVTTTLGYYFDLEFRWEAPSRGNSLDRDTWG